jgi:uncharacterized UBP type Zn finger protein
MQRVRPRRIECPHVTEAAAAARSDRCEDCGSRTSLRVCTECGYVGCCESQQGHDRDHARETGHPVIMSMPVGPGSFTWCYRCRRYVG